MVLITHWPQSRLVAISQSPMRLGQSPLQARQLVGLARFLTIRLLTPLDTLCLLIKLAVLRQQSIQVAQSTNIIQAPVNWILLNCTQAMEFIAIQTQYLAVIQFPQTQMRCL